ncbi:N-acetylglucosamine-6-phosphate deacetylase [Kitasatospora sp. NPDC093550]|uniref:N-acetylglucosamine-6-phosphate deacetylase n=1 Tax=Kitasatospora sp. NPDC093550 TaxID=3364089 RepID=UPI00380426A3
MSFSRVVLAGARLVLPGEVLVAGRIVVEGDRIAAVASGAAEPGDLDLTGHTVVPGFVDLHVHGGGGASYTSGIAEEALHAARTHLEHGTTTTVASTVTGEIDDLARQAAVLSELAEDGILAGIHFEGPFISPGRCGAHRPDLLRDPDPALVRTLLDAARGHARMLTLAPELPGGLHSIRMLTDLGVIAAIGHTDSDYPTTQEAIDAGATVATHLFNAMPAIAHRAPGPIIALLEDERVTVELINDGVHLHPSVLDLAHRTAGPSRVALITDAMAAAAMGDGRYPLGPLHVHVTNGIAMLPDGSSIAGSTLTLDTAFKRSVTVNGLTLHQTVEALSTTPARLLGLADSIGTLETGKLADLAVLDSTTHDLVAVMRRGHWITGAEHFAVVRTGW